MNCRNVEENLSSYLRGALPAAPKVELERHLRDCTACRDLMAVASGSLEKQPERPEEFLQGVLVRTTGSACLRARDLLCEYVDGHLTSFDESLAEAHFRGCRECTRLAHTLREMRKDLPAQAEMDPGRDFVAKSIRKASQAFRQGPWFSDPWAERFRRWWTALIGRPRFTWEAAYAGTLLIVLALGNPSSYGSFGDLALKQPAPLQHLSREVPVAWDTIAGRTTGAARNTTAQFLDSLATVNRSASEVLRNTWHRLLEQVREIQGN